MQYKKGYKYQVFKDEVFFTSLRPKETINTYYIMLTVSGVMTIRKSYAYDGPSGPAPDVNSSIRPSAFHDAGYQLMRMQLLPASCRETIDNDFGRFLREDGMWGFVSDIWVWSVKNFAGFAADPKYKKKVLVAP